MEQRPPPAEQRCLSTSATQENGAVMRRLESLRSGGGVRGGWQVALVKASTKRKMKKRGKVPPRFDILMGEKEKVRLKIPFLFFFLREKKIW
jgi:hypothetical protein